ncbi:MAG TPA: tetratricopeptide repeat protein [Rhodothermales bacterium]|nr:tetratricopeptide repeat protein [Rhodothermales bacterium]
MALFIYRSYYDTALDEAISAFKQAVRLDPDLVEALVNLASAYLMQQRFPQAQPLLETAIRLDAQNIAAYGNLGYLYLQQGQTMKAKQMFKKVLELSPNDPQAQQYLQQL